jgi:hypothetical protein
MAPEYSRLPYGAIQEDGRFAEHRAGGIHASDLHSILDDLYNVTPEELLNKSPFV